jgi:Flp pilus assembly protein TadB
MIPTAVVVLGGAAIAGALILTVGLFRRPLPHLSSTLNAIRNGGSASGWDALPESVPSGAGLIDRCGAWVLRVVSVRPSNRQLAQLRLRGITTTHFYGVRLVTALLCAGIALMIAGFGVALGLPFSLPIPAGGMVLAAVLGWFLPALSVSSSAAATLDDASEALLVFIDLVVLERLANQHARDALARAASVSDNHLFVQIRLALARAQLEREQPWGELRRLAERLDLPQLGDIADIARMQDEGGNLTDAFRARVAELRNAYVVKQQRDADRMTQRMAIPQTLPVAAVAFILMMPPILQLLGLG